MPRFKRAVRPAPVPLSELPACGTPKPLERYERERDRSPVVSRCYRSGASIHCHMCERRLARVDIAAQLIVLDDGWGEETQFSFCENCNFNEPCYNCRVRFQNGDRIVVFFPGCSEIAETAHHDCVIECSQCNNVDALKLMYDITPQGWIRNRVDGVRECWLDPPQKWCSSCHCECEKCGRYLDGLDSTEIFQKTSWHEHISYPAYCIGCAPEGYGDDDDDDDASG